MHVFLKPWALLSLGFFTTASFAHYPYIAPLNYQTFNNHSAVVSGFYDNPFVSEIAIKNFKFHYHTPAGEKIEIADDAWAKTQTLSGFSLENKQDGTYRIRGLKQGSASRFALVDGQWKALIHAKRDETKPLKASVAYQSDLKKNTKVKTVETQEIIETFVSRRSVSDVSVKHVHEGFDVRFISHPNALKVNQSIQLQIVDATQGAKDVDVSVLAQSYGFERADRVYQTLKSDDKGNLNFVIKDKGQYLLTIDYQQPFTAKGDQLKRYKYTLAFNVTD
jgi:hypothetical protein